MGPADQNHFSGSGIVFHDRPSIASATPAGYAVLIRHFDLDVPLPITLTAISDRHHEVLRDGWHLLTPRHAPAPTLFGHLTFALKYEGVDLVVLKRLFLAAGPAAIEAIVRDQPTSAYARRLWFLYEWLLDTRLDLPDAEGGRYVMALDPALQYDVPGTNSTRHRIRDNMPGSNRFCPLVFRSARMRYLEDLNLSDLAKNAAAAIGGDMLIRATSFLLLNDSRASYAIEGEHPDLRRIHHWGQVTAQAGRRPLSIAMLLNLQRQVLGDQRFIRLGLRTDGGFIGIHDRQTRMPIPDHISARHQDVPDLMDALVAFSNGPARQMDPAIAAAILSFGFVNIHPFEDGNGRVHRYLMHHILAENGFGLPGLSLPISSVIAERLDDYHAALTSYSARVLPSIDWSVTDQFNVAVNNHTADFYRYFDATPQAEFLLTCIERAILHDLPLEAAYLARYDAFCQGAGLVIDAPAKTLDLLFRFLEQNDGHLSQRARRKEFAVLTGHEVAGIEAAYAEAAKTQNAPHQGPQAKPPAPT